MVSIGVTKMVVTLKNNEFLSGEELRLSLCLYMDDFEICNPFGTSRKKHKLCGVYWILGNLQTVCESSLNSIYLALLCKSEDVKTFGYKKIFEPLLHDFATLIIHHSEIQSREVREGIFCLRTEELHHAHCSKCT